MLKEITHAKAIETLKSGGEIVIKRNPEPDVKYKIGDNCLMWTTGNAWNSMTTRSLADFLAEPVYIEAEPFTMSFECDLDSVTNLYGLLFGIGQIDWFVGDINYQIKISKQTYKPIDMGQVVANCYYCKEKQLYVSDLDYPSIISPITITDEFRLSQLREYNWFEQQTTTEVHERKFHEFSGFYPGIFCSGECTITITELEK